MKTKRTLKIIRFCLSVVMALVWDGATLYAQETTGPLSYVVLVKSQQAESPASPAVSILCQCVGTGLSDTTELPSTPARNRLKPKSEKTAFHLSLLGTLIPLSAGTLMLVADEGAGGDAPTASLSIIGASYLFGPSLGYFYGQRPGRGFLGMGIRLLLAPAPLAAAWGICGWDCGPGDAAAKWAAAAMGGGAGLIAAVDILLVKGAVRKYNRSLREKAFTIAPAYFAQHGAPGLKVQVQF